MTIDLADLPGTEIFVLDPAGVNVIEEMPVDFGFPRTRLYRRGESFIATVKRIAANTDRKGACWFNVADDPDLQELRWNKVRVGLEMDDAPLIEPGSPEAAVQADMERGLAWRTKTGAGLAAALRDVDRRLGRTSTSTTLSIDPRTTGQALQDATEQRRVVAAEYRRQADYAGGAA